ncbi:MAG: CDP-glycerol glycerophosphotransferase family protein [Flavobacteriales bacterium]
MKWYLFNIPRIILLFFLKVIFQSLQLLIKPTKNQLLFFASEAVWGDNLKNFYDYCTAQEGSNPVIIVKDKQLYESLKETKYFNCISANSFAGLMAFMKAEGVVIYNGSSKLHFFPYALIPSIKPVFNLWHGIPLKKIGREVELHRTKMSNYLFQQYSLFFVCSQTEAKLMQRCFNLNPESISVTGSSRNDLMLSENKSESLLADFTGKKICLYAPTWREYGDTSTFFPWENYDLNVLEKFLKSENIVLLLRGHRQELNHKKEEITFIEDSDWIFFAENDEFPDVNKLLAQTDILITDYSSIYLDFILLDKPIIFVPYDLEKYNRYRGFLMDYNAHTPGIKVTKANDFIPALKSSLQAPEKFLADRNLIKNKFHKHTDDRSSERILDEITRFIS